MQNQYSLPQAIFLHLAPGAIFTFFFWFAVSVFDAWGIDPIFALFGSIGLVLVPLELGYLSLYAHRATGSWSPLNAVDYKERVPRRRLALLAAGLAAWFELCLAVSIAFDAWIADNVFAWMPDALLQFATVEEGDDTLSRGALLAFLVIAFAFNGIAGPVTEELYFRGHLLPRLSRYGRGAPILNTALFAVYHFFRRGDTRRSLLGSSRLPGQPGACAAWWYPSPHT